MFDLEDLYQEIIMELSGSGSNLEDNCFQYTLVGGMVHISMIDDDGHCMEIVFNPAGSGT